MTDIDLQALEAVRSDTVRELTGAKFRSSLAPHAAVANGHDLHWDPPAAMTAALRWTCPCGDAAIRYGTNEYGSATERPCTLTESGDL